MKKEKHVNVFGVGLLLGSLFGYVVAYFNAEKPGEELQDELVTKGNIVKRQVHSGINSLKEDIKTAQAPELVEEADVEDEKIILSQASTDVIVVKEPTDI